MGAGCGKNEAKLEKPERDKLLYLIKQTETRKEFFARLKDMQQYNYNLSNTKIKQIFELLRKLLENEKKNQEKFYAVMFLFAFLKKYKRAREKFATNPLGDVILEDLEKIADKLPQYINSDKIRNWQERYAIVCVELLVYLVNCNKNMFFKFNEFLQRHKLGTENVMFYGAINHDLLDDVAKDAGGLTRGETDRSAAAVCGVFERGDRAAGR